MIVIDLRKWCLFMLTPFLLSCNELSNKSATGLCLMDEKESAIYVNPPMSVAPQSQPFFIRDATWTVEKSTDYFRGPVTDKRWEDFKIEYTDYFQFPNEKSVALSIFADKGLEVEIFLSDKKYPDSHTTTIIENKQWIHLDVQMKNGNVYIFRDRKLIKRTFRLKLEEIVIKSNETAYWKKHEYDYSYSEAAGPYKYTVPDEISSCLMLYVSMCSQCFLEIQNHTIKGDNEFGMDSWKHQKIEMTSDEVKEITLNKIRHDDSVRGYWGIDIRACPKTMDSKTMLNITLPEAEIHKIKQCRTLNNQEGEFRININGGLQMTQILAFFDRKDNVIITLIIVMIVMLVVIVTHHIILTIIKQQKRVLRQLTDLETILKGLEQVCSKSLNKKHEPDHDASNQDSQTSILISFYEAEEVEPLKKSDKQFETFLSSFQADLESLAAPNKLSRSLTLPNVFTNLGREALELRVQWAKDANTFHQWLSKIRTTMLEDSRSLEQLSVVKRKVLQMRERRLAFEKFIELGAVLEKHNYYLKYSTDSFIQEWTKVVKMSQKRVRALKEIQADNQVAVECLLLCPPRN